MTGYPRLTIFAFMLARGAGAQSNDSAWMDWMSHGVSAGAANRGEQADLRFVASVEGVYDTGIQPFSLDKSGKPAQVNGLVGTEAALGAYGVHNWSNAQLGLDYRGTYRHYNQATFFDGSDQTLQLHYKVQPSKRMVVDTHALGGTSSLGLTGPATNYAPSSNSVAAQPGLMLFDNRTNRVEAGLDASFLATGRTSITMGGSGYYVGYHSPGLVSVRGYDLHGAVTRRLTRYVSAGLDYARQHSDYPGQFGAADVNTYAGRISRDGRYWSMSLSGGIFTAKVEGEQRISFDPVIAALLGVPSGTQSDFAQTYRRRSMYPDGQALLSRKFRNARVTLGYSVGASPGNGVYLTSRQSSGSVSASYTGVRRWSLSIGGNYARMNSIGQGIAPYTQASGSAGTAYQIFKDFHATARFDSREQFVDLHGYRRASYRASVGLAFSPGDIPLSLW